MELLGPKVIYSRRNGWLAIPLKPSRAVILMIKLQVGKSIMSERFTETLRVASEPDWSHAVGHRFVEPAIAESTADRSRTSEAMGIWRSCAMVDRNTAGISSSAAWRSGNSPGQ
jgi:hypothetical protein